MARCALSKIVSIRMCLSHFSLATGRTSSMPTLLNNAENHMPQETLRYPTMTRQGEGETRRQGAMQELRLSLSPCLLVSLSLFSLAAAGCSKTPEGRMQVYPASGQVTVNGQPAAGAQVAFYGATPELT